jgi:hypothetical protein
MRELRDHLDDDIRLALKFETRVSARQKQAAWERLQQRAAVQMILPPIETSAVPPRVSWLSALRDGSLRLLNALLIDSSAFERARRPFPYVLFCDIQGRYVRPYVHFAA